MSIDNTQRFDLGIALDAGFADQGHLTSTFRRLVGVTPAAFRTRFGPHPARAPR
jgi:AraC-like DNA-binding protein